jgi:hypothetical protein
VLDRPLKVEELSSVFEVIESVIRRTLLKGTQDSKLIGRHHAFDNDREFALTSMLFEAFNNGHAMTNKELLQAVWGNIIQSEPMAAYIHSSGDILTHSKSAGPFHRKTRV